MLNGLAAGALMENSCWCGYQLSWAAAFWFGVGCFFVSVGDCFVSFLWQSKNFRRLKKVLEKLEVC